jgi:nickel superoxide dismutase
MKKGLICAVILSSSLLIAPHIFPHCEIPCGIYGDEVRFYIMEEHIATIEKSMNMIVEFSRDEDEGEEEEAETNYNQLVRWINNKEQHANYIQDIVSQYFMTQRVKPVSEEDSEQYEKYIEKLTLLHHMLIFAMKAKQSTDLENVEELRALLTNFRTAYFGSQRGEHRPPDKRHEH